MNEIWKDVTGWEGYYQVSNLGNVRSRDRWVENRGTSRFLAGKLMVPVKSTDGYLMVKFTRNNKATTYRIHRLVAEAFIENPDGLPEVNHLDCDRKNNIFTNLEWSTHAENVGHSRDKGHYKHYGADNQNAHVVLMCDRDHNEIRRFGWIRGCAEYLKQNGYTTGSVEQICSRLTYAIRRHKNMYGYYYKFA